MSCTGRSLTSQRLGFPQQTPICVSLLFPTVLPQPKISRESINPHYLIPLGLPFKHGCNWCKQLLTECNCPQALTILTRTIKLTLSALHSHPLPRNLRSLSHPEASSAQRLTNCRGCPDGCDLRRLLLIIVGRDVSWTPAAFLRKTFMRLRLREIRLLRLIG